MRKGALLTFISLLLLLNGCGKDAQSTMKNVAAVPVSSATELIHNTETDNRYEHENDTSAQPETDAQLETVTGVSDEEFEYILENIAFVGDSVTSGFGAYQKVKMSEVFAVPSVGPSNIKDYTFNYDGNEYAALTILSFEQPENVVVSMGLNDINTYSPENFSELYMEFIDDAMYVCPNSQFYIFSITPVSADCENISNETIDAVNESLKKTVDDYKDPRLHYIDCASTLKDEKGNMNEEFSGGDGIHLNSQAYDNMLKSFQNGISE